MYHRHATLACGAACLYATPRPSRLPFEAVGVDIHMRPPARYFGGEPALDPPPGRPRPPVLQCQHREPRVVRDGVQQRSATLWARNLRDLAEDPVGHPTDDLFAHGVGGEE